MLKITRNSAEAASNEDTVEHTDMKKPEIRQQKRSLARKFGLRKSLFRFINIDEMLRW
jgi:hypothetical protein